MLQAMNISPLASLYTKSKFSILLLLISKIEDDKFTTIYAKIKLYHNPTLVTDTKNILRNFVSRI